MSEPEDLYEILHLHPSAHQDIVQAAYRRLVLLYHPDKNPSPEATKLMAQVNQAYGVLGNPEKRAEYDRNRSTRLSPNGSWNTPVSSVWSTEPTARRSQDNTDYFTLGSTKDEVSQIHGSPDNVNIYRNIGIELWNYEEDDHVEFDLATGLVQAWANITGNLRIRMLPGRNRTDAQFFTERDHRDQVAQLEGIPAAILIDRRLDRERWYYLNRGTVEFSHSTGLVSDWEDDGGLKAKRSKGSEGTYRNRSTAVRGESRPAFTSNWRSLGGKYNRNGIHVSDMTNPDCWLVLQRRFKERYPGMREGRLGAWHGSAWLVRYYPAYPPATAAAHPARTVPGAAFPVPPGRPAAS